MGQEQSKKPVQRRSLIPLDAKITGPVPQPNPILKWIAENGDKLVGGAEMFAGFFDGNPGPEVLKAISVIPPAAARKFGEGLLKKLQESGQWSPEILQAFQAAQKRYPRLFGHIRAIQPPLPATYPASGQQGAGWRGVVTSKTRTTPGHQTTLSPGWEEVLPYLPPDKRVQASLNTSTLGFKSRPQSPPQTVHHELAHVAQQLRGGAGFEDAYRTASDILGYVKNPYEVRARQAGARAMLRQPVGEAPSIIPPWARQDETVKETAELIAEELTIERLFKEYIREIRANGGNVTPRASELYEALRRRSPGRSELFDEADGLKLFGGK